MPKGMENICFHDVLGVVGVLVAEGVLIAVERREFAG